MSNNKDIGHLIYDLDDQKSTVERKNAEIDRLNALVEEQKNLAKQDSKYKAKKAVSSIERPKNPNLTDHKK